MKKLLIPLLLALLFTSCGAYLNQPLKVSEATLANKTNLEQVLTELPKPSEPIVVAVYKFKDQTGQYKPSEVGSSFSTAVTQGGTNILIKALDDSGWFKVIERENIGNLLNERKIIRQTRMQFQENDNSKVLVNPLLFAGVIIEGGIVSYDANIVTGGIGVRYFGTGGSTAYRQDRVTVYLRAVATKTGEVLKNITTSKTILSQSLDGGVFRYVKFSRLLEAETGFTFNEPADIAVTEAVQKAVYALVMEGMKDGLWSVDPSYAKQSESAFQAYEREVTESELNDYLGVKKLPTTNNASVSLRTNSALYQGDLPSPILNLGIGIGGHYELNDYLGLSINYDRGRLATRDRIDIGTNSLDFDLRAKFLGAKQRSPFVSAGVGRVFTEGAESFSKFKLGIGLEQYLAKNISMNIYGDWNQFFSDGIDGVVGGQYVDYFYQFGVGVKYHFDIKRKNR